MKKKTFQFILIFANLFSLKAQLNADFSILDSTVCYGLPVQFTDLSTGNPTSWKWYFGDGDSTVLQNPSHPYFTSGNFDVTLIVSDGVNFDTAGKNISISIFPPLSVIATGSTTICQGSAVDMSAFATGGDGEPYTFLWSNGNIGQNQTVTPAGSYPDIVIYSVIAADGCSQQDTSTVVITFYQNPVATYMSVPAVGCCPLAISFAANTQNIASFIWDFGDGNFSSFPNSQHLLIPT